jgi:hypothetical protein
MEAYSRRTILPGAMTEIGPASTTAIEGVPETKQGACKGRERAGDQRLIALALVCIASGR